MATFARRVQRTLAFLGMAVLVALPIALPALPVQAQDTGVGEDIGAQLAAAGGKRGAGFGDPVDPRVTIMLLVRSILRLLAIIVFCYMLYAGYLWLTAGGNDEQIDKAKHTIRNATIGLVIILSSYSLTSMAINIAIGRPTNSFVALFL